VRHWSKKKMVDLCVQEKLCEDRHEKRGVILNDPGGNPEYRNLIDFCALLGIDVEKIEAQQIPQKPADAKARLLSCGITKG
jgi:hypothetical protein